MTSQDPVGRQAYRAEAVAPCEVFRARVPHLLFQTADGCPAGYRPWATCMNGGRRLPHVRTGSVLS